MVVAHKVVIRPGVPRDRRVSDAEMKRVLQAIFAARCGTRCLAGRP